MTRVLPSPKQLRRNDRDRERIRQLYVRNKLRREKSGREVRQVGSTPGTWPDEMSVWIPQRKTVKG